MKLVDVTLKFRVNLATVEIFFFFFPDVSATEVAITLNLPWNPAYKNKESQEHQILAANLTEGVSASFDISTISIVDTVTWNN